ncbi:CmcJ/NvfI family oxidoreductase [Emcibacter sp.]|uniref:CmcJ/NvfI family oxidoreductase n=1 Tax=Emcibacter sp. TaxID=1979954 RepID=UPI003A9421DC
MAETVHGEINYIAPMEVRPRYHANDTSQDILELDVRTVEIINARSLEDAPRFDREGFVLAGHKSKVGDFFDPQAIQAEYSREIADLVGEITGADEVLVNAPGVLRFGEKSDLSGALNNSRPARFIHVDISPETARNMMQASAPEGKKIRRFVHINVWRALTPAPQDVPLALCDARTVARADLVFADAIFDEPGKPEWSFEGIVVAHNPAHRWCYFRDMNVDEVLVFSTCDSEQGWPSQVPHSAFNDPSCPPDTPPRASIEMRAIAYWYE